MYDDDENDGPSLFIPCMLLAVGFALLCGAVTRLLKWIEVMQSITL